MEPLSPHEGATFRRIALGRERFQRLPNDAAISEVKDEAAAVLRRHLQHARDR